MGELKLQTTCNNMQHIFYISYTHTRSEMLKVGEGQTDRTSGDEKEVTG